MKVNKKLLLIIFSVAAVIGLCTTVSMGFSLYLYHEGLMAETDIDRYEYYLNAIYQWIGPITLFSASFILGKTTNLRTDLKTTIISIYWRCFIGFYLGYIVGYSSMSSLNGVFDPTVSIFIGLIPSIASGVGLFLTSFTAIVITNYIDNIETVELQNMTNDQNLG